MPSEPHRIGRFEVVEMLGRGGMGVVYRARDLELGRDVALKVLRRVDDDDTLSGDQLRERFAREARSAAKLTHRNIVTIFDVGESDGRSYIAMEYLDGETVAEIVRRAAPLPLEHKIDWMRQLCAGLGYAHRAGIIHRDIKPANLVITRAGVLKIVDFGLARFDTQSTGDGLTRHGSLLGTPHYMSPEQIEGRPVDHRSDIFSVAAVFYEIVTYRKAFAGETTAAVLNRILNGVAPPIPELPSGWSEVEAIIGKGLVKDPAQRFQHLEEIALALRRFPGSVQPTEVDLDDGTLSGNRIPGRAPAMPDKVQSVGIDRAQEPRVAPGRSRWRRFIPVAAPLVLVGAVTGFLLWAALGDSTAPHVARQQVAEQSPPVTPVDPVPPDRVEPPPANADPPRPLPSDVPSPPPDRKTGSGRRGVDAKIESPPPSSAPGLRPPQTVLVPPVGAEKLPGLIAQNPDPNKTDPRINSGATSAEIKAPPAVPLSPPAALNTAAAAETAIDEVLKRFKLAYDTRNASLMVEVWPAQTVDGLTKAYKDIRSQRIDFKKCAELVIAPEGLTASKSCEGVQMTQLNRGGPDTKNYLFGFDFAKKGDEWKIRNFTLTPR